MAEAGDAGKLRIIDVSFDLSAPYTLWAGRLGGAFLTMGSHGTDQLIVQRLLTCRDLAASRKALIGSGFAVLAQFGLFLVVGLGLWAMSTLSSSINSLASASAYDFWAPARPGATGADLLRAGRRFTWLWGAALVGAAVLFIPLSRESVAVEVSLGIASLVYGGLLGIFALARFAPGVGPAAARVAIVSGVLGMTLLWIVARSAIGWPWFVFLGTGLTVVCGLVASRVRRPGTPRR